MIRPEDCALILLAAGRSERFGQDKLALMLDGKPLARHAVDAVAGLAFAARIAVVGGTEVDFAESGFDVVRNPDPGAGQGSSLALAIEAIERRGVSAALILLADMPRITAGHVAELLAMGAGDSSMVASSNGAHAMPPALFGRAHFADLRSVSGDRGARAMLDRALLVIASPVLLADVDTPGDLTNLKSSNA